MLSWCQARFLAGRSKLEALLGKYYPAAVANINPKSKKALVKVRRPNVRPSEAPRLSLSPILRSTTLPMGRRPMSGCPLDMLKSKVPPASRALNRFQSCLRMSSGGFEGKGCQGRHGHPENDSTQKLRHKNGLSFRVPGV